MPLRPGGFSCNENPMKILNLSKRTLNVTLALAAAVVVVIYTFCGESCTYLRGSLLGVEMPYAGILFMLFVAALSFLKRARALAALLSAGAGAEIYLLGFQLYHGVYCPYCILFGALLFLLFFLNAGALRLKWVAVGVAAGLLVFSLLFEGSVTPAYAEENLVPSFGGGMTRVRLYTDYFCGPCASLEPEIAKSIEELVRKNAISITFIDTPIHRETTLYARYFLYTLKENRKFAKAMEARSVLFEASRNGITDEAGLGDYLTRRGVRFKRVDVKSAFDTLSRYLAEDKIRSTPTMTVVTGGKKETFSGVTDISRAVHQLRATRLQ